MSAGGHGLADFRILSHVKGIQIVDVTMGVTGTISENYKDNYN